MGIETLFGIFKTRGFCLESTHLTDPQRLSKLIGLLSLALCWVVLTGEWLHQGKPLKIKTHGRRAKSLFRYGFDYLRNILMNLNQKMDDFLDILQFLSCTQAKSLEYYTDDLTSKMLNLHITQPLVFIFSCGAIESVALSMTSISNADSTESMGICPAPVLSSHNPTT
jgi:hypothetical protein